MNWYKQSQQAPLPIRITSYDGEWVIGISFNGSKTYYFPGFNYPLHEYMVSLQKNKNYPKMAKIINNVKEKNKKKTPRGYTPEEEQQMLSELPSQKELWGNNELAKK